MSHSLQTRQATRKRRCIPQRQTGQGSTIQTLTLPNAALTSLAAQASITLIDNKGNIGQTLSDLSKSSTVKAVLSAALTAGALQQIGVLPGMSDLANGNLADKLTFNMINATGRALTTAAINGGDLESALKGALLGGLVDTLHGEVAGKIKGLESEYVVHKLAHALAGCVAGAAVGGACQDGAVGAAVGEIVVLLGEVANALEGAVGAAVGEIVVQLMPPANGTNYTEAEKGKVLTYSKLIAGGVAAYTGGNAQTAMTTAETAVLNNGLRELLFPRNLPSQSFSTVVGGQAVERLAAIDTERNRITLVQPNEKGLYAAGTGGEALSGYTVIFSHATVGTIAGVSPQNSEDWSKFVGLIQNSKAWKPGQSILIDACNAGKVDDGVASALAKALGVNVVASNTTTWNIPSFSTSGFTGAYDKLTDTVPNPFSPGIWKTFGADGKLVSASLSPPKPIK